MRNGNLLKSHFSGIRVKRIRVNQGVDVIGILIGIYTWLCLFLVENHLEDMEVLVRSRDTPVKLHWYQLMILSKKKLFQIPWEKSQVGIFSFCLLSFPQNERKICKLRQLFFVIVNIDGSTNRWLCPQKIYKLRQTKYRGFFAYAVLLVSGKTTV